MLAEAYNRYTGTYVIEVVDRTTKEVIKRILGKNTITYTGADIFAEALSTKITHIYGEHAAYPGSGYVEGSTNGLEAQKTDDLSTMRTSPRSTTDAEVPVSDFSLSRSSNDYANNVVKFTSVFNNANTVGEIFVGAALVMKDGSNETIFAHSYFPAEIQQSNNDLIIYWSVTCL